MLRIIACAGAMSALLCGCSSDGTAMGAGAMPAAATPSTRAADYIRLAGGSDLFEIQSSETALRRSKREDVRSFAQMMVEHHTQTTATLLSATRAAGLPAPPDALPRPKAQMLSTLRQASDAEFDQVYLSQQLMAHQEALAVHQTYAQGGDNATLRQVAAAATPIVQQHLTSVQSLAR